MRSPLDEIWLRILRRIETTSEGCWQWQGATNNGGYGVVGIGKKRTALVHRIAVLAQGHEIPEGWQVDHACHDSILCRELASCPHRRCVNPDHLVVMTPGANNRRKYESGTCRKGHPYSERSDGRHRCRTCDAESAARRRQEVTA